MKNILKLMGIIALAAVIGFAMAACDTGGGSGNNNNNNSGSGSAALVGKWYATQDDADKGVEESKIPIEFTSDGKVKKYGTDRGAYTVSGNSITILGSTVTYSISGTKLTITGNVDDIIKDSPNYYYKKK
jgi:hypothetical protein